ncbi:MAG TPA: acyl transferase [Ferruginibacter sp.]|nr:acyl transferase [Ferruginibacter sp.]HRO17991.1 acyl transferase [Ferruginibacter sp.]HRQ20281.1 acyl transferase [Ferruginibacter sp.]
MDTLEQLEQQLFKLQLNEFESLAIQIFHQQYTHNSLYRSFCDQLHIRTADVRHLHEIPFLPISLFKRFQVTTTPFTPELIFESSRTTGSIPSVHHVKKAELYQRSFLKGFEHFYGKPEQYSFLALLPSYLERQQSSLVYMVEHLMQHTPMPCNFYLHNLDALYHQLLENERNEVPTMLFGVTFALLDFAAKHPMQLQHTLVMETGGMKGRRDEMTREEVHAELIQQLGVKEVHSEYGMTELLSQAYARANGVFECPPWMQVLARNEEDPLDVHVPGKPVRGVANIIDLCNLYSCAFIATDDLVSIEDHNRFKVLGRLDNSDVRGCNLMYVS